MVPIVEPEVLMDGDHDIDTCYKITTQVLNECYNELEIHNVNLGGTILKPNMVLPDHFQKKKFPMRKLQKKP